MKKPLSGNKNTESDAIAESRGAEPTESIQRRLNHIYFLPELDCRDKTRTFPAFWLNFAMPASPGSLLF